jgi:hypothetical protein
MNTLSATISNFYSNAIKKFSPTGKIQKVSADKNRISTYDLTADMLKNIVSPSSTDTKFTFVRINDSFYENLDTDFDIRIRKFSDKDIFGKISGTVYILKDIYEDILEDFGIAKKSTIIDLEEARAEYNLQKKLAKASKEEKSESIGRSSLVEKPYFMYACNGAFCDVKKPLTDILEKRKGYKILWYPCSVRDFKRAAGTFDKFYKLDSEINEGFSYIIIAVADCVYKSAKNKLPSYGDLFTEKFKELKEKFNARIKLEKVYTDMTYYSSFNVENSTAAYKRLEQTKEVLGKDHIVVKYFETLFDNWKKAYAVLRVNPSYKFPVSVRLKDENKEFNLFGKSEKYFTVDEYDFTQSFFRDYYFSEFIESLQRIKMIDYMTSEELISIKNISLLSK